MAHAERCLMCLGFSLTQRGEPCHDCGDKGWVMVDDAPPPYPGGPTWSCPPPYLGPWTWTGVLTC